jgi:competence protein ComEC
MVACYPCIIVSLTALASLLMLPSSGYFFMIPGLLFCGSAVCLSFHGMPVCGNGKGGERGILLSDRPIASRLMFCGIGLALGAWCSAVLVSREAAAHTSLPLEEITAFEGITLADSRKISGGSSLHTIALKVVISTDARADARGRAAVFDESGSVYALGERLLIWGGLRRNRETPAEQFVSSTREIVIQGNPSAVLRFRAAARRKLDLHVERLGYPASSLFRALFLGMREDMPPEVSSGFEKTGTLHILALSGLHVGIVSLLIFLLLRPIASPWIKWAAVLILLGFYLFLAGPKPSLLRASLFLLLYGISRLLDRDWHPLNILGLTLLLCLLIDPGSAFQLSFQLSFLAMFGILTVGKAAAFLLEPYVPRFINIPLCYSFGAQIAVLPISVVTFGVFYPAGIVVTPLLLPLVTVFLWLGIVCLPILAIDAFPLHRMISGIMDILYQGIRHVLGFFSQAPGIGGKHVLTAYSVLLCLVAVFMIFLHARGGWRWHAPSKPRV